MPATGGATTYFVYGCIAGMSSMMMDPDETLVMVLGGLRLASPVLWCLSLANGLLCGLVYWVFWPGGATAAAETQ